jgi:hypothetical protein
LKSRKKIVQENILNRRRSGSSSLLESDFCPFPDKISDVIAFLELLLGDVPPKYRDRAYISFSAHTDRDGFDALHVNAFFERKETDAEEMDRTQWARDKHEKAERAEYERLKAKFEGKP